MEIYAFLCEIGLDDLGYVTTGGEKDDLQCGILYSIASFQYCATACVDSCIRTKLIELNGTSQETDLKCLTYAVPSCIQSFFSCANEC